MATASPHQLNPNAPPYLPLPPPLPVKIFTPHYLPFHVIPSDCQLISYYYPQPAELHHVISGDGAVEVKAETRVSMRNGFRASLCRNTKRRKCVTGRGKSGEYGGGGTRGHGGEEGGSATDTVMIKNIPNQLSRKMMLEFLDKLCDSHNMQPKCTFRCEFDFVYLPMDFRSGNNLGYAFVNFTTSDAARWIKKTLSGYKWGVFENSAGSCWESKKICQVTWARIQGRDNLIDHFRTSIFECCTDDYLPVILTPPRNGATSFSSSITIGRHIGSNH